jgi:hypothetical protein
MALFFLIIIMITITAFILKKDKIFRQKKIKDVIEDEEMKALLNLPHKSASFDKELKILSQKRDVSRQILEEINSNED